MEGKARAGSNHDVTLRKEAWQRLLRSRVTRWRRGRKLSVCAGRWLVGCRVVVCLQHSLGVGTQEVWVAGLQSMTQISATCASGSVCVCVCTYPMSTSLNGHPRLTEMEQTVTRTGYWVERLPEL